MAVKSKDTFVKGAVVLGIAGLICKIIGAFYRVALFNILSASGMAYYEMAYPIYSFLLVLSTAGLPTAISKLVSEKAAIDDYRAAHRTFQTAYKTLFYIGVITMSLMLIGAPIYANMYNLKEGVHSLRAIAPALLFVSVVSAYRGYFQGLQIMTPTALSQLMEQVGKLVVGFGFASYFFKYGAEYGAMGALLGVSISEFLAMLLLIIMYNVHKGDIKQNMRKYNYTRRETKKEIIRKILMVAFPVTIGASIMPLAGMVDGFIAMNLLSKAGFSAAESQQLYGVYSGSITSIINMPAVVSLSIGVSLVPAISSALAGRSYGRAKHTACIGFKLAILFGLPCAVGMFLVAEPVLNLLYKTLTPYELPIAVKLLKIMAFAVLFLTIVQVMTSIIQGYGKYKIPVITLFIGSVVNIAISALLVIRPDFNIAGVAIGTACCYAFAAICNTIYVFIISGMKFKIVDYLIRPLIANLIMGTVVYFVFTPLMKILGSNVALMATILIAVLVYLILVIGIRAVDAEDMDYMPGGGRLHNLMYKMGVWKQ